MMDSKKDLRLIILRGLVLDDVRQWTDRAIVDYAFRNGMIWTEEYNGLIMYLDDMVIVDMKNLEEDDK